MRNILIIITLMSGLIFTSFIKNKTRLVEKELLYLDNKINNLSFSLSEASLDFQYLTTPKHISLLAKNFLDENFIYYKESQIKKSIKPEKDLAILKKLKNDNTFNQLSAEELVNKKLSVTKKIETQIKEDVFAGKETVKYLAILKKLKKNNISSQLSNGELINKKLNITKETDSKQSQKSKKINVSKKIHNWVGLQIVKSLIGIPNIPVK